MKRLLLLCFFLIKCLTTFACDCDWAGDFLTAGLKQDLVVKVKILGYFKHDSDINEKMTVQIIEKFRGKETRKTITVWGDNGADCRPYVDYFEIGQEYFLALTKFGNDYYQSNCGDFYLTIKDGKVNSRSRVRADLQKIGEMDLKEFEEMLKHN